MRLTWREVTRGPYQRSADARSPYKTERKDRVEHTLKERHHYKRDPLKLRLPTPVQREEPWLWAQGVWTRSIGDLTRRFPARPRLTWEHTAGAVWIGRLSLGEYELQIGALEERTKQLTRLFHGRMGVYPE